MTVPAVVAPEELDAESVPGLRGLLAACDPTAEVVLDMSSVTFLDSSALTVLIAERTRCEHAGGIFVLASPTSVVLRLLALTELTDVFEIRPYQ